jgi:MFS family permease
VLLAYLVFNTAEWATYLALLVWAFGHGGATAAGLVAVIQLVPSALIAPLGSVLGDRMRRSRALALGYAAQAVTLLATALALLADLPFGWVAVVAATASCAVTLTRPVHHAIMPDVAHSPDELTAGNSASSTVEGVAAFVGPALSGVMLAAWGPGSVYLLMAVLSAGSAMLVLGLNIRGGAVRAGGSRLVPAAVAGFRELRGDSGATLLVGMVAAQYVVVGLMDILTVVLALDVLGLSQSGPGWLTSALGVGAVTGGAATVVLVGRRRLAAPLALAILATGLPVAALALAARPWPAAVLLALSGAGKAFFDVTGRTLLQRTVRASVLARIFGIQEGLMMGGLAVGATLAPIALSWLGPRGAFLCTGLLLPILGLTAWVSIRRLDDRAQQPGPLFDVLARLPVFAPLPQWTLEQLSWATTVTEVPSGQDVVRQGDPGDLFYVVADGQLEVRRNGQQVRTLGPGDGFGEIALLRDTPRTATVTTTTAVVLGTLERDDFLLAVTGQAASRTAADVQVDRYLADDERG